MVAESAPPHNKAYRYRKGDIAIKEVRNYGKIVLATSKKVLNMASRRMHNPRDPKNIRSNIPMK